MLSRRGFLGALTALVTVPRSLFARVSRVRGTYTGTVDEWMPPATGLEGTYYYKVTYVSATGETQVPSTLTSTGRKMQ